MVTEAAGGGGPTPRERAAERPAEKNITAFEMDREKGGTTESTA